MKKIAILGCENSHANAFLKCIKETEKYSDVEVIGVYSEDAEASKKLSDEFGVPVLESADAAVGKVDGLIITARHGAKHYEWAKLYMKSGIPMFIDKPINCSEEDAIALAKDIVANNVKFVGGSSVIHAPALRELVKRTAEIPDEEIYGGFFRAPISPDSPHGGFSFYAAHLLALMTSVLGNYPDSVTAENIGGRVDGIVNYGDKKAHFTYTNDSWAYYAYLSHKGGIEGGEVFLTDVYASEFDEYYNILSGGECKTDVRDFIAPVFIMNAIERAFNSGKCEAVHKIEI